MSSCNQVNEYCMLLFLICIEMKSKIKGQVVSFQAHFHQLLEILGESYRSLGLCVWSDNHEVDLFDFTILSRLLTLLLIMSMVFLHRCWASFLPNQESLLEFRLFTLNTYCWFLRRCFQCYLLRFRSLIGRAILLRAVQWSFCRLPIASLSDF